MDLFFASLFTIFLWWASTSILLAFTRNESEESSFSTIFVSTCILLLGFVILISSSDSTTVTSAYLGFVSVLMIWSWQEAAFLVGWITGTRTTACPNNVTGFKRAWLAFQTISHHELLLVVLGIVIWLVTFNSPNDIGIQTFLILWIMRISAKLNVFLGVRNFYEEFLPSNLSYLATYFKRKSYNLLFPFILTAALIVDMLFWYNAGIASNPYGRVSFGLMAALLALGVLEHILMILPFQLVSIWRLGLSKRI